MWSSLRLTPGDGLATLIIRVFEKTPRCDQVRTAFPHKEREIVANAHCVAAIIAQGRYCLFRFDPSKEHGGWTASLMEVRTSPVHVFQLPDEPAPDPEAEFDKRHGLCSTVVNTVFSDTAD